MRPFLSAEEFGVLRAFTAITDQNPFATSRVDAERAALGDSFVPYAEVWHADAALDGLNPNVPKLIAHVEALVEDLRRRLVDGARGTPGELRCYQGAVFYTLYERYNDDLYHLAFNPDRSPTDPVPSYPQYKEDFNHFLLLPGVEFPLKYSATHMFALGYQVRRAFEVTFRGISGGSGPAARLRAAVWHSIFTRDAHRYRRSLYDRMADIPTLIVGESGTGKELVARAIAHSRYVPFNERKRCFEADTTALFRPVNLSVLSASLIESELFGHRKGAFTGAVDARGGWLESCHPLGAIFLDEIGELESAIQVKLLRVLQDRIFQRIGETQEQVFEGKIIAATNRDLAEEIEGGRFRRDFYYRLCADVIRTPTLAEQIADSPDELENLVLILARRIVGADEADAFAEEVVPWIDQNLGREYGWPGNVRELEQCLRNVLVRGEYRPLRASPVTPMSLSQAIAEGALTADELLREYCTRVYRDAGSYQEAARRLGLDRRTVKARIDGELLERLRS